MSRTLVRKGGPDSALAALPDAVDALDGWSADELEKLLTAAAPALVAAEGKLTGWQLGYGRVLYRLRLEAGDGDYGQRVARIAQRSGVSARTLARWRTLAEEHDELPPPTVRTIARRERELTPNRPKSAPEHVTPDAVVTAPSAPQASQRAPVAASRPVEQLALPGSERWGQAGVATVLELAEWPVDDLVRMQRKIAEALRLARRPARSTVARPVERREVVPRFKGGR